MPRLSITGLPGFVHFDKQGIYRINPVGVGEPVVAEAALDLDAGALDEGGEVRHPITLEGGDLVPGVIKRL